MTGTFHILQTATLAVGVPMAVFTGNWVHRANRGYSQTAAADFLLAILIFDGSVVLAGHDFAHFLRSPELRDLMGPWHFIIGFIGVMIWLAVVGWAEPVLESYYADRGNSPSRRFPIFTFVTCWLAVLVLIALHVGFFAIRLGGETGHA